LHESYDIDKAAGYGVSQKQNSSQHMRQLNNTVQGKKNRYPEKYHAKKIFALLFYQHIYGKNRRYRIETQEAGGFTWIPDILQRIQKALQIEKHLVDGIPAV
jgi:hypothetical protein